MKTIVVLGSALLFMLCAWTYGADSQKETERDGRFVAYDNNTVLDTQTHLMWAATDNGTALSWPDAKSFCEQFRGGDYNDWRLPTASELQGLYDMARSYKLSPAPNDSRVGGPYDVSEVHLTKLIRLTGSSAWSSDANDSTFSALIFSFHYGGKAVGRPQYKAFIDADGRALPVRTVK